MHELALMESLVETVDGEVDAARVTMVRLELGRLSCASADALRFCFEVCTRGTRLEGAVLDIVEIPGRARCRDCGSVLVLEAPYGACACGCFDLEVLTGRELLVREVEVI